MWSLAGEPALVPWETGREHDKSARKFCWQPGLTWQLKIKSWWRDRNCLFWVLPWLISLRKVSVETGKHCKIKWFRQMCVPGALRCRLQNVPVGKNQSLSENLTWGQEGGRKGGGGGERVWYLNRRSFLTVQRRWRQPVTESVIQCTELSFLHFAQFVALRKRREFSFGDAQVPVPRSRMHLVVEPIEEAMMKMLPVCMDKAGLTQREINHMWVQLWSQIELKLIWSSFVNNIDIQTHEVSGLDAKTFVLHVRDAMTSFSSPCLFWLPYIFLALVFVENLIVGCYRIRKATAVSFECQSLIWVLELYPSVIHHSLTVGPSACILTLTESGRCKKPSELDKSSCWASTTVLDNAETSVWPGLCVIYYTPKSFVSVNVPRWSGSSPLSSMWALKVWPRDHSLAKKRWSDPLHNVCVQNCYFCLEQLTELEWRFFHTGSVWTGKSPQVMTSIC